MKPASTLAGQDIGYIPAAQPGLLFPHRRRGRKATEEAGILARFRGTAVHDNWGTYWHYQACKHGLYNAHHLRNLTAIEEIEQQHWATHFKTLLRSAKHLVEAAKETGLEPLPTAKSEQIERVYDKLVTLALLKNQPPAGGWPTGKRGRPKKTKPHNLAGGCKNDGPLSWLLSMISRYRLITTWPNVIFGCSKGNRKYRAVFAAHRGLKAFVSFGVISRLCEDKATTFGQR